MKLRSRSATKAKVSPFIKTNSNNGIRKSNPVTTSTSASSGSKPTSSNSNSRGTFASTISACWNTHTATSTSTSFTSIRASSSSTTTTASSSKQGQTPNKTTCLLCPNAVLLNQQQNAGSNIRLHKLLVNLCKHFEISSEEIPNRSHCTKINFPFCGNCETLLIELWKQQKILDEANLKIQKIVGDIEHVVVDAEILGTRAKRQGSSSMAQAEQQKSTKLRDLILEGYRNKLLRKHQKDNDPNTTRPVVTEPSAVEVKRELFEQTDTETETFTSSAPSTSTEVLNQDFIESDYDEDLEELPPSLIRQDIGASHNNVGGGDDNDGEEQEQFSPEGMEAEDPESFVWSVDPGVVARYNDANCTMVITSENAETGATSSIQVKQERIAALAEEYDDGDDADSDQDGDIYALAERKRRFLFEGVEIFRATGARSKVDYLQCSLCSFMLPIKKYNTSKVSSPYMKMKTHILHVHKRKSGVPKQPRPRQLSCIPCNIKFSNLAELREHKAQHPPRTSFDCDICGKPFREGSSQYNLLIHKFSHKNDEERKVALAAGERGSYNCMLSTKLNMALLAGGGKGPTVPRRKKPIINTGNAHRASAPAEINRNPRKSEVRIEGNGIQFKCQVCRRLFARKCHLMRHMGSHTHVGSLKDEYTPSTSTANRSAPIRRQTVRAQPVTPTPTIPLHSNLGNLSVAGNSSSGIDDSIDRGQRVAVGDGTVVIVKREVLELLMNN